MTRRNGEIILFWRICHLDIFTDARLTDITTSFSPFQTILALALSELHPMISTSLIILSLELP